MALAVFLAGPLVGSLARAEEIDDPKVARRLGTRIDWTSPTPPAQSPAATASPPAGSTGSAPVPALAAGPGAEGTIPDGAAATVVASPVGETPFQPASPPRLKLAYRRFDFVRIGASDSGNGIAVSEPFNTVSVDVYPVSSLLRVGLSTQYGWQSGSWVANGDYFAAESLSVGVQMLGQRVTPFAEGFAGIGYMRRVQFDRTVPTAYWQLGFDVGAEIYFARVGFVSAAIGYLRPVNGMAKVQEFQTVFVDTWSFKLGIGL